MQKIIWDIGMSVDNGKSLYLKRARYVTFDNLISACRESFAAYDEVKK